MLLLTLLAPYIGQAQFSQVSKITATDAFRGDLFGGGATIGGNRVSISGDYAIIGASQNDDAGSSSGSAYIFKRLGNIWTEQQKLTASDAMFFDEFGSSVSISGDYAIIGAPTAANAAGAAYIFKRDGNTWIEQQKLIYPDAGPQDRFGLSVCISDDYAVIGAPYTGPGHVNIGSVHIFKRIGDLWTEQQKLISSDAEPNDQFGLSVSISEDYVLVGAPDNDHGVFRSGAAYVFKKTGNTWIEQQKLTASDADNSAHFGRKVSISGNYALIGAPERNDDGTSSGAAYVFNQSENIWIEQQKLLASDAGADDRFGSGLSISGDYIIVGAFGNSDLTGAAYIFKRTGNTWPEQQKIIASDAFGGNEFGWSVSISGENAIVGSPGTPVGGRFNSGAAYVFENQPTDIFQDTISIMVTDSSAIILEEDIIHSGITAILSSSSDNGNLVAIDISDQLAGFFIDPISQDTLPMEGAGQNRIPIPNGYSSVLLYFIDGQGNDSIAEEDKVSEVSIASVMGVIHPTNNTISLTIQNIDECNPFGVYTDFEDRVGYGEHIGGNTLNISGDKFGTVIYTSTLETLLHPNTTLNSGICIFADTSCENQQD